MEMAKHTKNVPAVTNAAQRAGEVASFKSSIAGRAIARLASTGERIAAALDSAPERSLELVLVKNQPLRARVRAGKTTFDIEGENWGVTTHD
jgi:hypothetical protein